MAVATVVVSSTSWIDAPGGALVTVTVWADAGPATMVAMNAAASASGRQNTLMLASTFPILGRVCPCYLKASLRSAAILRCQASSSVDPITMRPTERPAQRPTTPHRHQKQSA